jgi:hypothetical protein
VQCGVCDCCPSSDKGAPVVEQGESAERNSDFSTLGARAPRDGIEFPV